jgi:hypothetical protein
LWQRVLALVLLMLVLLPWYELVGDRGTGPAVEQTLRLGDLYFSNGWLAALLTAASALLLSRLIPRRAAVAAWERAQATLLRPGSTALAVVLGGIAAAISLWVSAGVLDGKPALLDAVAQLVQARYVASGMLAGPPLEDAEFWQFQFMVETERGWVSQYPPAFLLLLGVGQKLGVVWLVGPLLLGVAVAITTLIAERLLPHDRVVARLGAVLVAISPVLIFHAASYMNHVLALVLGVIAIYASLRAMDGPRSWSVLSGAALGGIFATRPYAGLIVGVLATVGVWLLLGERPVARWLRHVVGTLAGAAPFTIALLLYNRHFFGSPVRFGYAVAEGPAHGLGFHVDPWGNPYGPLEALGYTSADLQGLSLDLLQSPLPAVLLIALALLAVRLGHGTGFLAAWAMLPVAAHALYWHHDLFMGPRLLYEALPAWCLLLAAAAVGLVRSIPADGSRLWITRSGLAVTFALAVIASALYAGPRKLASYAREGERSGMTVSAPEVERASLVFVHGAWLDRVAARLAASGMRVDSIRAALAHNTTCRVELYLEQRERGAATAATIAFQPSPQSTLRELTMPSGSVMRSTDGEALHPTCVREASSDFAGVVGLPPLLWQGDLPGVGEEGALFARDFGPERNARLIARFPDREPWVLVSREGAIRLMIYPEAMGELWGDAGGSVGGR